MDQLGPAPVQPCRQCGPRISIQQAGGAGLHNPSIEGSVAVAVWASDGCGPFPGPWLTSDGVTERNVVFPSGYDLYEKTL